MVESELSEVAASVAFADLVEQSGGVVFDLLIESDGNASGVAGESVEVSEFLQR